jgi:hypothetical protein
LLCGLPGWDDHRSRRVFIRDALYGHPILDQLQQNGGPASVAAELLDLCESLDTPTAEGLHPHCALLQAIRRLVGPGGRRDAILTDLERALCQAPPNSSSSRSVRSILLLAADPSDLARLRLATEFREIQEKLRLAVYRDRFALHQRMALRPADLSQAMLDLQPEIVHFSGHGSGADGLYLEDEWGQGKLVTGEALAALFRTFADRTKAVILNACFTEPQAEAIAEHIDFVIGTRREIGDDTATVFSLGFYQALGAGRSIEDAFNLGCTQIQLQGLGEHLVPVLLRKPGKVSPDA